MVRANPKSGDEVEIRTEQKPEWRKVRVLVGVSVQFLWQDEAADNSPIGFMHYDSEDWREIDQ